MPLIDGPECLVIDGWAGVGLTYMARMMGNDGEPIQIAQIDTIQLVVKDGSTTVLTENIDPMTSIFDTMQDSDDDPRWTGTSAGFNFLHVVSQNAFPSAGKKYVGQYLFTPFTGSPFKSAFFNITRTPFDV